MIEEGIKTLQKLSLLIDGKLNRKPMFKMVLTAVGDYAYQRPDGIIVCPISALCP